MHENPPGKEKENGFFDNPSSENHDFSVCTRDISEGNYGAWDIAFAQSEAEANHSGFQK